MGDFIASPPHLVTLVKWLSVIMLLAAELQSSWAQSRDWKILLFQWEVLNPAADSSKGKKVEKLLSSNCFMSRSALTYVAFREKQTLMNGRCLRGAPMAFLLWRTLCSTIRLAHGCFLQQLFLHVKFKAFCFMWLLQCDSFHLVNALAHEAVCLYFQVSLVNL